MLTVIAKRYADKENPPPSIEAEMTARRELAAAKEAALLSLLEAEPTTPSGPLKGR